MVDIPFPVRTARLDLRPYEDGDLEAVRDLYGPSDVHRYLYSAPPDEAGLRDYLAKKVSRCVLTGEGDGLTLLGVDRETGEAVGDAVLMWVSEEHHTGEIGFVVKDTCRGRGYATEMGAAMMALGFDTLRLHRLVGRLDARNTASAAVLERLGMRREAHLVDNEWVKGEWCSELDYALLADEWASRSSA